MLAPPNPPFEKRLSETWRTPLSMALFALPFNLLLNRDLELLANGYFQVTMKKKQRILKQPSGGRPCGAFHIAFSGVLSFVREMIIAHGLSGEEKFNAVTKCVTFVGGKNIAGVYRGAFPSSLPSLVCPALCTLIGVDATVRRNLMRQVGTSKKLSCVTRPQHTQGPYRVLSETPCLSRWQFRWATSALPREGTRYLHRNNPKFLISGPKFWNNPENQQRFMKRVGDELGIKEVLHILLPHLTKY